MCSSYHFLSPLVTISLFFVLVHFYFVDKFICSSFKIACIRGFPESSVVKESTCNAGDPSLIPESGRSPGEGNGCPLQCSGLENSMGCIAQGVAKSRTRLSNFHLLVFERWAARLYLVTPLLMYQHLFHKSQFVEIWVTFILYYYKNMKVQILAHPSLVICLIIFKDNFLEVELLHWMV